jgi:glycerophosphoryl diester phosphodiesterase
MHPAIASTRPLVFAHRGGAALAPENSIPAFDRGLAEGADGLELDVHLSRDGVVVVHHDDLLDRTTNAIGPIGGRTAAELAALDVTGRAGRPGERAGVPTLREVLHRYPDVPLIVELKTASQVLARAVVDEVRAAGAAGRVCLGSFSWRALRAVRAYEPLIPTGAARLEVRIALYCSWVNRVPPVPAYRVLQVPEVRGRTRVVSPRFVDLAHRRGLAVQVWAVDAADDMRRLLDWGVDALISDRPDVAAGVVRERERRRPG